MQDNQDGRDRAPLGFAFEGRDTLTSTGKMRCESQRGAINESHAKETTEVQPHIEPRGSQYFQVSHCLSRNQSTAKLPAR